VKLDGKIFLERAGNPERRRQKEDEEILLLKVLFTQKPHDSAG